MPYTTQNEIQTAIPANFLNDALDDDGDGNADAGLLDIIIAKASQAVDSFLAGIFTTPFPDPAPAKVREAAFVFTCELIYKRRPAGEKNPWTSQANALREELTKIGKREQPFDAGQVKAVVPGAVISDCVSIDTQST